MQGVLRMSYQYGGTQRGPADPWQQPQGRQPRPNQPHVPGITWDGRRGRWAVRLQYGGKRHTLGSFPNDEYGEAVAMIEAAREAIPPKPEKSAPPAKVRELQPCGTHAAYQRHHKAGEPIDLACRRAEYEYVESHRKSRAA